jgi:hypothetical protein
VTVLVIDNTVYLRGDAFTLTNYMGLPASAAARYAARWIRIPHTSSAFAAPAAAVRLASALDELKIPPPVTSAGRATIQGKRVIGVRGRQTQAGHTLTETIYVRASGQPLPVEVVGQSATAKLKEVFSHWNEHLTLAAPASATTLH